MVDAYVGGRMRNACTPPPNRSVRSWLENKGCDAGISMETDVKFELDSAVEIDGAAELEKRSNGG